MCNKRINIAAFVPHFISYWFLFCKYLPAYYGSCAEDINGYAIYLSSSVIWIRIQRRISKGTNCTRTYIYAPHIKELKAEKCPNLQNEGPRVQFLEADLVAVPLPLLVAERPESHAHCDVGVGHPGIQTGVKSRNPGRETNEMAAKPQRL
jgi:hypothetical protein